ncbi:hypothetical protein B484DRAFT_404686 [Ochromonadaceae sp. CCMP2298]|nr:hypothetical protein B484DRAFT_404686 [Ochromonadaceae sp. CCMP2298]
MVRRWSSRLFLYLTTCPQHEHMERHKKLHGVRMDKMERDRKREARKVHKISDFAQRAHGLR